MRILFCIILVTHLFGCATQEYKRAAARGGAYGYVDKEVKPGVWVLEVGTGGGANKLGLLIDYFDRRANELCTQGYIGGYDVIPSHQLFFKPLRCYRRGCYNFPVVSGVIRCASGEEVDKSTIKTRPKTLKQKTADDFVYTKPKLASITGLSTIKGLKEIDAPYIWRTIKVSLIDNKDVSYFFKSETATKVPIAPGEHNLLITANFNDTKYKHCPCAVYVKVNLMIQEGMDYIVKGEVDDKNINIWVEELGSEKKVTLKHLVKHN